MITIRTRVNARTDRVEHKAYCDVCKRNVHKVWLADRELAELDGTQHDRLFATDHRLPR